MRLSEITGAGGVAGMSHNLFSTPVRRKEDRNMMTNTPTIQDAKEAAKKIGIDFKKVKFTIHDLLAGMTEEMKEHGNSGKDLDVIPNLKSGKDNPLYAAKIALAHLRTKPDYYKEEN